MTSNGRQTTPNFKSTAKVALIFAAIFAAILAPSFFHRSALVYPVPLFFTLVGVSVGGLLGLSAAGWVYIKRQKDIGWKVVPACVILPLVGMPMGSYVARLAYEIYSFTGVQSISETQITAVVDMVVGRNCCSATVRAQHGGREVSVPVDDETIDEIDVWRRPGRDCLKLYIERGRNGVRRFVIPAKFFDEPIGIEAWIECPKTLAFPAIPA